jgi:hypothetical protein
MYGTGNDNDEAAATRRRTTNKGVTLHLAGGARLRIAPSSIRQASAMNWYDNRETREVLLE